MKAKYKFLTYRGAVRPSEVNGHRQMKLQIYVDRYEQSGRQFFALVGLTKAALDRLNAGIAVVEHDIKFNGFLFEDDLIYIESNLVEFTEKVFTVYHEIKDSITDEVKSSAYVKLLLFDLDKRKAIPISDEMEKKLNELL